MKIKLLTAILLIIPSLTFAQFEFKPIIDTSLICLHHVEKSMDRMPNPLYKYETKKPHIFVFYITEEMPEPKHSVNEIENMLEQNVRLSEKEKELNDEMYFQCVVNCKGEAGDYQIIHCPDGFDFICSKTFTIFREEITN